MPEGTSNSLVNLGDLSKPADTLVKKISKAVGGIAAPWQIKRVAKAEAEADIIKAKAGIEITDLQRRAMHRFIEEEAKFQQNMEEITAKALPLLTDAAKPEAVEDDWITNFFDKSRIISDSEMQALWSKILAGEANAPGTFCKRTVNLLTDMDRSDASLFARLCDFVWEIESSKDPVPIVFTKFGVKRFQPTEINNSSLRHLQAIGLVHTEELEFARHFKADQKLTVHYYERPLLLNIKKDNFLTLGNVQLTKTGKELVPICGGKPVHGFWEFMQQKWNQFVS